MIFNDEKAKLLTDGGGVYMCEYIPSNRKGFDDWRSREFVLDFKDTSRYNHKKALNKVSKYLKKIVGRDFAVAVIPSSKVEKNYISAGHELAKDLIESVGSTNNIIDASCCLTRVCDTDSYHSSPGKPRNIDDFINTVEVRDKHLIQGKDVLVIDDISTSGTSFKAARKLLKESGATNVLLFVVGKTISDRNLQYGFIFDLDNTLFHTDSIEPYRKKGSWDIAIEMASRLEPADGVLELFNQINLLNNSKIQVVTMSPRGYAKKLVDILKERTKMDIGLISYHDTDKHKPDIEPYQKARQRMMILEKCITVFGDTETDIEPANELGMNSVLISEYCPTEEKSKPKHYYKTMTEVAKNFRKIIAPVEEVRKVLCNSLESS